MWFSNYSQQIEKLKEVLHLCRKIKVCYHQLHYYRIYLYKITNLNFTFSLILIPNCTIIDLFIKL